MDDGGWSCRIVWSMMQRTPLYDCVCGQRVALLGRTAALFPRTQLHLLRPMLSIVAHDGGGFAPLLSIWILSGVPLRRIAIILGYHLPLCTVSQNLL